MVSKVVWGGLHGRCVPSGAHPRKGTGVGFTLGDGAWDRRTLGAGAQLGPTLGDGARYGPTRGEGAEGGPIRGGACVGAIALRTGAGVVVHAGGGSDGI
jgi:hypothetical protein